MEPPAGYRRASEREVSDFMRSEARDLLDKPLGFTSEPLRDLDGRIFRVAIETHANAPKGASVFVLDDTDDSVGGLERPRTPTPATEADMRQALLAAGATEKQLPFLLAHTAVETGQWRSLIQHNIGNVIANDRGSSPFWRPTWFAEPGPDASERIKRLHRGMLEGTQPRAFRAYDSLADGTEAYMGTLRRVHPGMLEAAENGTPEQFVEEWGKRYTPDLDEEATLPGFKSLWARFGGRETAPILSPGASDALALGIVTAGLAGVAWLLLRR